MVAFGQGGAGTMSWHQQNTRPNIYGRRPLLLLLGVSPAGC